MMRGTFGHRSQFAHAVCALGTMLLPALMTAQLDRSRPPVAGPAPEVRIGQHSLSKLSNGMQLIVVEDHKLPMVSVQVRFDVPPIVQGDKAGYVDLFGELLMAGAGELSKADIDRNVDAIGASLHTGNDGLFASVLKKNLAPLMDVVREVVTAPTFPQSELDGALTRANSAVQQRKEDPEGIAEAVGRSVTFGRAHPYGEVTTAKTLAKVDRAMLAAYHRHFFRPEKGYLVFVGDVTEKEAMAMARTYFGKWKQPASATTTDELGRVLVEGLGLVVPLGKAAAPPKQRSVYVVDRPGAAQSVIRVAYPLPLEPKDVRAQQAQVMNTILGGGIFNARLMQNLRETHGYTYGCYSSLDVDRFNSSFTVSTSVRTEVTDSAVAEIIGEMERMRLLPVTTSELELAKSSMMGSFGRSLEDPRTVARFALNTRLSGLAQDHYSTYLTRLASVNAQQVMDAAGAFLHPDQAAILVVGDLTRIGTGLRRFCVDRDLAVIQLTEEGERWQEELVPVTDRTAEQVIEAYLHAIGGREKIAPIRHLQLEYAQDRQGEAWEALEWFAPDQYRMQLKNGNELVEEITFDGKRVLYSDGVNSGELTDAGYEATLLQSLPVQETRYDKVLERLTLQGKTTLKGREVYKLSLTMRTGNSFQQYYDVETGLKVRRVEEQYFNGRVYRRVLDFADWKPIAGVLFPHHTEEQGGVSGAVIADLKASKVNAAMPASHFAVVIPEVPDGPVPPEMLPPEYTPQEHE
ncbi:MAG: insulinase family protein [Flavobacteriales bacterium]|nr:insulinase family protein [Flavobacteriales bacterium]